MLDIGKSYTVQIHEGGTTFAGYDFGAKFTCIYQIGAVILLHKASVSQWIGRGGISGVSPAAYVLGCKFGNEFQIIEYVEPGRKSRTEKNRLIERVKKISHEMGYSL